MLENFITNNMYKKIGQGLTQSLKHMYTQKILFIFSCFDIQKAVVSSYFATGLSKLAFFMRLFWTYHDVFFAG